MSAARDGSSAITRTALPGANVHMNDDLWALRDSVTQFMRREVQPAEDSVPHDTYELPPELLKPLRESARRSGLWMLSSPESAGGSGLSLLAETVVTEEAAKCRMGVYHIACNAFGWDPPGVVFKGTPEQIEKYAAATVASGGDTFVAITEPSGGADPARSIKTRAEKTAEGWVINGTKVFISSADHADWGIVFARTDPTAGRHGISVFIVDRNTPGITVQPIPVLRSWAPYEVNFTDVVVPHESLLGSEGQGFALAQEWFVHGRVPYAAGCIGVASAALEIAVRYANDRETFGSKLGDKQAVQWMLADSEIELRSARALTYEAAAMADAGMDFKVEASIAKVTATETAGRIVDRCIQILGGLGVSRELPLERWYRELRIKRIGEGPSEVHRMVVARSMLNPSGAPRPPR